MILHLFIHFIFNIFFGLNSSLWNKNQRKKHFFHEWTGSLVWSIVYKIYDGGLLVRKKHAQLVHTKSFKWHWFKFLTFSPFPSLLLSRGKLSHDKLMNRFVYWYAVAIDNTTFLWTIKRMGESNNEKKIKKDLVQHKKLYKIFLSGMRSTDEKKSRERKKKSAYRTFCPSAVSFFFIHRKFNWHKIHVSGSQ